MSERTCWCGKPSVIMSGACEDHVPGGRPPQRTLPWVGWIDESGSHLSTWCGETREVVLTVAKSPIDPLPPGYEVYEVPAGRCAKDVARETGGIVVIVFDVPERLGPEWSRGVR